MNEELLKKLKKSLRSHEIHDDVIRDILDELEGTPADEGKEGDEKPTEETETENVEVEPNDEKATDEGENNEGEGNDVESEPAPEVNEPAPETNPVETEPVDNTTTVEGEVDPAAIIDNAENEPAQEPVVENPTETETAPVVEPAVPPVDYEKEIADQKAVIDALKQELVSLKSALEESGILTHEEGTNVGHDESSVPANDPEDDPMESILQQFNRH